MPIIGRAALRAMLRFGALAGKHDAQYSPDTEVYMELSKKTTILFSPETHERLTDLAARRGKSLGELVREACVAQYGLVDAETRVAAVATLTALSLPVGTPREMKEESVPDAMVPMSRATR
jgi:predicted DNA-binding protein